MWLSGCLSFWSAASATRACSPAFAHVVITEVTERARGRAQNLSSGSTPPTGFFGPAISECRADGDGARPGLFLLLSLAASAIGAFCDGELLFPRPSTSLLARNRLNPETGRGHPSPSRRTSSLPSTASCQRTRKFCIFAPQTTAQEKLFNSVGLLQYSRVKLDLPYSQNNCFCRSSRGRRGSFALVLLPFPHPCAGGMQGLVPLDARPHIYVGASIGATRLRLFSFFSLAAAVAVEVIGLSADLPWKLHQWA
ncbi:hypothetical protein F5Y17DRAFT_441580 [Xylariaceae sp. FL0594]|nr:hypothetical protein F5Y17DRAFT_441580 [Xylariaceae sp. FL0594]